MRRWSSGWWRGPRDLGGPAVVFTFDPHPAQLLYPEAVPPPLTWTERKAELLAALGVDAVIAYPTDRAVLALTPDEFFEQILREQLAVRAIVEGPNFFFGRNRSGTIEYLAQLCAAPASCWRWSSRCWPTESACRAAGFAS